MNGQKYIRSAVLAVTLFAAACGPEGASDEDPSVLEGALPSAKATYWAGDIAIMNSAQMNWSSVMKAQLKTSNQKTLFINASLECGLYTSTTVRSKQGTKDTSTAMAVVKTQIMVDGKAAQPGPVVFCMRSQTLSATLGGILDQCTDANGDGTISSTECTWTEEEISLVLNTMSANSFNFIADVGQGVHNIEVQAMIDSSTSVQLGSADAKATIGKGSVVVTEQRLVR